MAEGDGTESGAAMHDAAARGRHALIIVENLPVPFDRRVWQEATALRAAGWRVSVICPTGKGCDALFETLEGVEIHRGRRFTRPVAFLCTGRHPSSGRPVPGDGAYS